MYQNITNNEKLSPALYLVPTPIGNLEDITLRSLRILRQSDIIACEDTRHSGNLLKLLDINYKKLESYHEHNEKEKSVYLIDKINQGYSVSLITDAGTPGISDPGYRLVNEAIKNNIQVVPLPGATAFVPALVASGLAVDKFIFLGFPPQKKGRLSFLTNIAKNEFTTIIYESPYKILKLCDELIEQCGTERQAVFARELSKIHEEIIRGSLADCKKVLSEKVTIKGEFVIVLQGNK